MFIASNTQTSAQGYIEHEESVKPATQQETNKALGTNTSEMDIYKYHDKEFKTIILR